MKLKLFNCLLFVMFLLKGYTQTISPIEFKNPDKDYAPMTWWHWVNGNITKDGIRKDLIALDNAGMRGVQVFNAHMYMPTGPIEYGSDSWYEMMIYAIHVCDSLGLKFTMMNSAGWSGAGGPWITSDRAMKKLVYSEIKVTGGGTVQLTLPKPVTVDNYLKEIAVLAVPDTYPAGQIKDLDSKILMGESPQYLFHQLDEKQAIPLNNIINLTSKVDANGVLTWNVPKGKWNIIRFCYTLTGKKNHPAAYGGEGYEVDKLNADYVAFQFRESVGKLLDKIKDDQNKTVEGILFDSYEAHYQNWTENLPLEFNKEFGYNLIDYLPLFSGRYVESVEKSEKVLSDFRRLLDKMLAENFYGTMQRLAHEHGLVTYAEAQGGPVSTSLAVNYVDIPMNEFWNPDASPRLPKMKLTGSLAAIRNKDLVGAEAFTSKPEDGKWQNTPWTMKKPGDLAFTTGINRFCFHTFVHQPVDYAVPGFTMGRYGTLFSRHLTWWKMANDWITYLTRSQYLLQQGKRVTDICFLFNNEARYGFPNNVVDLPNGFDYTIIYPQDLENAQTVNGELVLKSGLKFQTIILPEGWIIEQPTAIALMKLVRQGCQLICASSSLKSLEIKDIMNDGNQSMLKVGKGKIFINSAVENALLQANVMPDIQVAKKEFQGNVCFIHRETENEHIYFLSSQADKSFDSDVSFNVTGLTPQLWDQSTGLVSDLPFKLDKGKVSTHLSFDPCGSCFVVFDKNKVAKSPETLKMADYIDTTSYSINGPWKISFADKQQMSESIELKTLSSLDLYHDDRVKYYSGTMTYTTDFELKVTKQQKSQYILDLGEIHDIAEIYINGNKVGIIWKKPYRIDITKEFRNGNNELEIVIANTWCNRIIGDENLTSEIEYDFNGTKFTNGRLAKYPSWLYSGSKPDSVKRFTFTTWKHYNKDSKLSPSGLIGPVQLLQTTDKNN